MAELIAQARAVRADAQALRAHTLGLRLDSRRRVLQSKRVSSDVAVARVRLQEFRESPLPWHQPDDELRLTLVVLD